MLGYLIAGGIFLLAIIFSIYFLTKGKQRSKAIRHYELIRDKLTLREPEIKEEVEELEEEIEGGEMNLTSLIGGLIVLIVTATIGVTIINGLGNVMTSPEAAIAQNITRGLNESYTTMTNIFPIMLVILVAMMIIGIVVRASNTFSSGSESVGWSVKKEEVKKGIKKYKNMRDKITHGKAKNNNKGYLENTIQIIERRNKK